jgi:hypothetical protein
MFSFSFRIYPEFHSPVTICRLKHVAAEALDDAPYQYWDILTNYVLQDVRYSSEMCSLVWVTYFYFDTFSKQYRYIG